jgi:hypothetical protein
MRIRLILLTAVVALLAVPVAASAHPKTLSLLERAGTAASFLTHPPDDGGANFATSRNMRLLSFSERRAGPDQFQEFNSDLAFWGDRAYQGHFTGFRIFDLDDPRRPRLLADYEGCPDPNGGGQGDVVVWGSILVRSWDVNTPAAGGTCDGEAVAPSFEGVHVFDVSDPSNPDLVAQVNTQCGSHTATGVPDLRNRRLIVYSTPSSGQCDGVDVIEVPLSRPQESELLRFELAGRDVANANTFACHDTGAILGRAMKLSCAGGAGFAVWSLGGADGGSLDNPRFLYNQVVPEIAFGSPNANEGPTGHSAAFTWDGETIIFGHEPGGGFDPRCMATGEDLPDRGEVAVQNDNQKSFYFYDTDSGAKQGQWVFDTRPQTGTENCTLHNYNMVPTKRGDILVHGSYQSGTAVLDMSDLDDAEEIAFADPAPLAIPQLAGDWSSYWYNGYIYESDITRGLFTWKLEDRAVRDAMRVRHLNPQTQEFTIGAKRDDDRWDPDDWHGDDDDDDRGDDDD